MGDHDAMVHLCVGESASEHEARSVWRVYESVFDDYPSYAAWFEGMWGRHSGRDGFRLVRAFDGDDLVGFAWGYTGRRGQWWTD